MATARTVKTTKGVTTTKVANQVTNEEKGDR